MSLPSRKCSVRVYTTQQSMGWGGGSARDKIGKCVFNLVNGTVFNWVKQEPFKDTELIGYCDYVSL